MPITEIKRPHYYEGQYLGAADLLAAQEYQRQQDQRHWLAAHTWGIADGLELREEPIPGSKDAVEVVLQPGYAVDGFGRAIVVLAPWKLPPKLFARFPADPSGRSLIPIWLQYRESKADSQRVMGSCSCNSESSARILEAWEVIVGEVPSGQQHDSILVGGAVGGETPRPVPHQLLPDPDRAARWLIPLGSVTWSGTQLVKADQAADYLKNRRHIGVVASVIEAPTGTLHLQRRPTGGLLGFFSMLSVTIQGSLETTGSFRCGHGTKFGTIHAGSMAIPKNSTRKASISVKLPESAFMSPPTVVANVRSVPKGKPEFYTISIGSVSNDVFVANVFRIDKAAGWESLHLDWLAWT